MYTHIQTDGWNYSLLKLTSVYAGKLEKALNNLIFKRTKSFVFARIPSHTTQTVQQEQAGEGGGGGTCVPHHNQAQGGGQEPRPQHGPHVYHQTHMEETAYLGSSVGVLRRPVPSITGISPSLTTSVPSI